MTKKIIEYGFMGDEQGITYVINHKPHVINNKYKFYKVIKKVEPKKSEEKKINVEPKKVENKFIKKPEVVSNKKDESKIDLTDKSIKKDLQKVDLVKNDNIQITNSNTNKQNKNLLYGIPVIIVILILIIYYLIPSSKSQFFGRSQI